MSTYHRPFLSEDALEEIDKIFETNRRKNMTPQKYQELVDKIVEAVASYGQVSRGVTLDEVMLALREEEKNFSISVRGIFYDDDGESTTLKWLFGRVLSQQSDEVKEWLYSVIVKK
jgi:hypothetical protein